MLYQIEVESADGSFAPWEIVDLPTAAAAYERCQALSAMHDGKTFSAGPVASPPMMIPVVQMRGVLRRHPVIVAAICGALASGPLWWAVFHFL